MMRGQEREKSGLLAAALARHAAYFDYDAGRGVAQIDDVEVSLADVLADYEAACLELWCACSMGVEDAQD